MKLYHLLLGAALCSTVSSCFKDEPLNAECDIEQAYVHLDTPTDVFFAESDTLVNVIYTSNNIVFEIKDDADVSQMAPVFKLTEGATVTPESGSVHDFSDNKVVTYVVRSQDGAWTREYNVSFRPPITPDEFSFDNARLVDGDNGGQYYVFSDLTEDGYWIGDWATGNPGYNLSAMFMGSEVPADKYPTASVDDAVNGKAVKLTTCSTGFFGTAMGMGLAAGNLFIGEFDVNKALVGTDGAMQATQFGRSFGQEPLQLTGWYKYKSAGECVDGRQKPILGSYDKGDIYAVLYRNKDADGGKFYLHGDDVKTSPQIVAIAQVDVKDNVNEWTEFTVDFEYRQQIDRELLRNRGYNIAVVCTSSIEGASFRGAIGSTLYIDEVKVICADQNE